MHGSGSFDDVKVHLAMAPDAVVLNLLLFCFVCSCALCFVFVFAVCFPVFAR